MHGLKGTEGNKYNKYPKPGILTLKMSSVYCNFFLPFLRSPTCQGFLFIEIQRMTLTIWLLRINFMIFILGHQVSKSIQWPTNPISLISNNSWKLETNWLILLDLFMMWDTWAILGPQNWGGQARECSACPGTKVNCFSQSERTIRPRGGKKIVDCRHPNWTLP